MFNFVLKYYKVVSFNGEKKATENYDKALTKAYKTGRNEGLVNGLGMGAVFMIIFCSYALAVWYGSKLIIDKGYSGGDTINILFAVMMGGMYVFHSNDLYFFLFNFHLIN